jgi:hypothetical protein
VLSMSKAKCTHFSIDGETVRATRVRKGQLNEMPGTRADAPPLTSTTTAFTLDFSRVRIDFGDHASHVRTVRLALDIAHGYSQSVATSSPSTRAPSYARTLS